MPILLYPILKGLGNSRASVLWNLDVTNYHPSFRTFISDVLVLINTRSKSADPKKERFEIILFLSCKFSTYTK